MYGAAPQDQTQQEHGNLRLKGAFTFIYTTRYIRYKKRLTYDRMQDKYFSKARQISLLLFSIVNGTINSHQFREGVSGAPAIP